MKNLLWIQKAACDKQRVVKIGEAYPNPTENSCKSSFTSTSETSNSSGWIELDFCGVLFPLARPGYIELYNFMYLSYIYIKINTNIIKYNTYKIQYQYINYFHSIRYLCEYLQFHTHLMQLVPLMPQGSQDLCDEHPQLSPKIWGARTFRWFSAPVHWLSNS